MKTLQTASRDVRTESGFRTPSGVRREPDVRARSSDRRRRSERTSVNLILKISACAATVVLALLPALRTSAQSAQEQQHAQQQSQQQWKLPEIHWAFPVRDKVQPVIDERSGQIHVPGSAKTYTQEQIDDLANPPDWFPDEHAPMPKVVARGGGGDILGCASCHLGSGLGHPESANLAGMSGAYILRQLGDFKARRRMGEGMNDIARDLSDQDAQEASEWFANLKPRSDWQKVEETDRVPKTFINEHLMRMPLPGGEDEPIGDRIIELPQDIARAESRDPHSGFVAYVPKGSIAKGKELVATGGGGKTISCPICHGPDLGGLGEVPAIAGHSPLYLFRQLYYFKEGSRNGSMSALMKGVVKQLTQGDMLALAAYVGSLPPAAADNSSSAPPGATSVGSAAGVYAQKPTK
jgi:cytochrome c553